MHYLSCDNLLTLPNQTTSLTDCIQAFKTEEQLSTHDLWTCSNCHKEVSVFKKLDFYSMSKYIIFSLNRFTNNVVFDSANQKIDDDIVYPLTLGLKVGKEDKEYKLIGVINHTGSMESGHYTAMCYNSML
jgi:ubiquitin C-terminal hydrolase